MRTLIEIFVSRVQRYYADKLCVTVKHLSQVTKEKSGRPALEFIEQYVITECKACCYPPR